MPRFRDEKDNCLSECFVGRALAGLSIGVLISNPAGKVIWLNRAAERILGVQDGDLLGNTMRRALKDPRLSLFWHQQADGNGNGSGHSTTAELSVGYPERLQLKVSVTPCCQPDGGLIGHALLLCDVTHERTAQIELSNAVATRLLELAGEEEGDPEPASDLTAQELQVIRLVGKGLGNREIADHLGISLSTVRSHLKNIYRKLGLASRAAAVSYAVRNHLS